MSLARNEDGCVGSRSLLYEPNKEEGRIGVFECKLIDSQKFIEKFVGWDKWPIFFNF